MLPVARLSQHLVIDDDEGVAIRHYEIEFTETAAVVRGDSVQAAYAVGLRLSMIVPMICFPLATACATLVGQNLGAGNPSRAWRTR